MPPDELLTVQEVASLLGIKPGTVYEAIVEKRLSCVVKYGRKLIKQADALTYQKRTQPEGCVIQHRPAGVVNRLREPIRQRKRLEIKKAGSYSG